MLDTLPAERDELVRRGYENIKRFSWAITKAGWLDIFRKAGLPSSQVLGSSTQPPMVPLSTVLEELATSQLPYPNVERPIPINFQQSFDLLNSYIRQEENNWFVKLPVIGRVYRAFYRLRFLPKNWAVTLSIMRGLIEYQMQIERELERFENNSTPRN